MSRINTDTECFYTPRTCGALSAQLEFDFGPEFKGAVSENEVATTTYKNQPETRGNKTVSLKTGRISNED
jgi:hypothetical protein